MDAAGVAGEVWMWGALVEEVMVALWKLNEKEDLMSVRTEMRSGRVKIIADVVVAVNNSL